MEQQAHQAAETMSRLGQFMAPNPAQPPAGTGSNVFQNTANNFKHASQASNPYFVPKAPLTHPGFAAQALQHPGMANPFNAAELRQEAESSVGKEGLLGAHSTNSENANLVHGTATSNEAAATSESPWWEVDVPDIENYLKEFEPGLELRPDVGVTNAAGVAIEDQQGLFDSIELHKIGIRVESDPKLWETLPYEKQQAIAQEVEKEKQRQEAMEVHNAL